MSQSKVPAISAEVTDTTLTLTFSNGETLTVDATSLSPDIQTAACLHGLKQKLVDAAAIARNTDTGASATLEDKFNAVREVFERITAPDGTWNKQAKGGTGSSSGGSGLLLRALMELTGQSKVKIDAYLSTKSKAEKAALRASPKVAPIIARYQADKATVDTEALLGELL
jgi:hypothetical protein